MPLSSSARATILVVAAAVCALCAIAGAAVWLLGGFDLMSPPAGSTTSRRGGSPRRAAAAPTVVFSRVKYGFAIHPAFRGLPTPLTDGPRSRFATREHLNSTECSLRLPLLEQGTNRQHRRQWELCVLAYHMEQLGFVTEGAMGLGITVVNEPLPSYFVARGVELVVTDTPQSGINTTGASWNPRIVNEARYAANTNHFVFDPHRDALPLLLRGSFDFAWSTTTLQHYASCRDAAGFIRTTLRAVRPGGVVAHVLEMAVHRATKVLPYEHGGACVWTIVRLRKFARELVTEGHEVFPIDDRVGEVAPFDYDSPPYRADNHMILGVPDRSLVMTSFMLLVRRGASDGGACVLAGNGTAPVPAADDPDRGGPEILPQFRMARELGRAHSKLAVREELHVDNCTRYLRKMYPDNVTVAAIEHRQLWEICVTAHALDAHGVLRAGARGVGIGVGSSPLASYAVSRGCNVSVAELPSVKLSVLRAQRKSDAEVRAAALADSWKPHVIDFATYVERAQHVPAHPLRLPPELMNEDYDFVWSRSLMEHLGGCHTARSYIFRTLHALKPGGVAVHTTEFAISSEAAAVAGGEESCLWTRPLLDELIADVEHAGHTVAPMHYAVGPVVPEEFDVRPYSSTDHMALLDGDGRVVHTSAVLVIVRARGPFSDPPPRNRPPNKRRMQKAGR